MSRSEFTEMSLAQDDKLGAVDAAVDVAVDGRVTSINLIVLSFFFAQCFKRHPEKTLFHIKIGDQNSMNESINNYYISVFVVWYGLVREIQNWTLYSFQYVFSIFNRSGALMLRADT